LRPDHSLSSRFRTHSRKRTKGVICQDVDAPMVRFQVVDLLAEDEHPEVFAEELYGVEGVGEAGAVFGKPIFVL
jgi:hypothetical protein